jgi:hypothetical protein
MNRLMAPMSATKVQSWTRSPGRFSASSIDKLHGSGKLHGCRKSGGAGSGGRKFGTALAGTAH